MAKTDRDKWDTRYRDKPGDTLPSQIIEKLIHFVPIGNALDIACGNGRNSIYLANKGFVVDAVDISTVATRRLAGRHPDIHVMCLDIDEWTIPNNRYELIVNIRFLDRRLFPMMVEGLRPGGVLIFESFAGGNKMAYTLRQNELLQVFRSLHIVYYEEKTFDTSERFAKTVSLVAIKHIQG